MRRVRQAAIAWSARATMVAHAREAAPRECCGLLVGEGRRVDLAVPLSNVDPRPRTGFQVDPAEHIAVRRILRRVVPGREIVGVYHSHPAGAARPSPRDIAESHYPEWLYAIVGRGGRTLRVYEMRPAGPVAVPIRWRRPVASRPRR
jgi:proteasome lid subunit RPN8/RPN11